MRLILAAAIALTLPLHALSDVPHVFKAGDPAKASEVNENFQALSDVISAKDILINENVSEIARVNNITITNSEEIEKLKKIDSIHLRCENNGRDSYLHSVSYEEKYANVGSLVYGDITSSTEFHILISYPLASENGVLDKRIIFPFKGNFLTGQKLISFKADDGEVFCSDFKVSGSPAKITKLINKVDVIGSTSFYTSTNTKIHYVHSTTTTTLELSIKINDIIVIINIFTKGRDGSGSGASSRLVGDSHFISTNFENSMPRIDPSLMNGINELIDYVRVESY